MASKKILLLLLGGIILPRISAAQTEQVTAPKIFRDPPNSASINKYGDYAVNLSSGVPSISIPIFEVTSGSLKMPITLDYHASGIKVTDLASWAGLGWAINSGGQISRRVYGKPDDNSNGYLSSNWRNASTIDPCASDADVTYLNDVRLGLIDTQPDIFSYNYPGGNGKFFFNSNNSFIPTLIPMAPVSIKRNIVAGSAGSIASFGLKDESGNTYDFGLSAVETSSATSNGTTVQSKSSWMLERLISQNRRDSITISYTNGGYSTPIDNIYSINLDDLSVNQPNTNYYQDNTGVLNPVGTSSSTINEQKLSVINFKHGKVVFDLSGDDRQDLLTQTGVKRLQDIKVYGIDYSTKTYKLQKTIQFFHSYFINGSDANTKRLRLDSLQILNATGQVVQRYRFEYNDLSLPTYTSTARDYWGYYNGKNQSILVPRMTVAVQNGNTFNIDSVTIGSNIWNGRDPDSVYMQACVLKKIVYPTGGYTRFNYQTNRYLDNGIEKQAGGLRIQSILSFDGLDGIPKNVKTYQYASPKTNFKLENYVFTISKDHRYIPNGDVSFKATKRTRTFVSTASIDVEPWEATPVFYQTVTEYNGVSPKNAGKTVYKFRFVQDQTNSTFVDGRPIVSSFFFERGQLLEKAIYKRLTTGSYQVLQRETSTYTSFPLTWNLAGLGVSRTMVNDPNDGVYGPGGAHPPDDCHDWRYNNFSIPSDDNYITSRTTKIYDQDDSTKFQTNIENYYYDNVVHQQITRKYTQDSRGKTIITRNRYPVDYLVGNTTNNAVLDSMINRNMQGQLIESWDTVKVGTNPGLVTSASLNRFKQGSLSAIVPADKSTLDVSTPLSDFVPATVVSNQITADSRYRLRLSLIAYDTKNNLTKYTFDNSPTTVDIWDYKNDMPVAEIKNSFGNDAYTSFEADGKGGWTFSGSPVADATAPTGKMAYNLGNGSITLSSLNNTRPYNLTYWSKTGVATIAGTTGSKLYQNTDGWSLYKHIIPTGTVNLTISGSVIIDELRLYADIAKVQTYTYEPSVGLTAMADGKGLITRYDYDDFQRLFNIRDYQRNIVKNFSYNYYFKTSYPAEIFYNAPVTGTFKRSNCDADHIGGSVSFTEPYAKFNSTVSQADADQQAQTALAIDGQAYANANAPCNPLFYNIEASQAFSKNNCGVGYAGSSVTYTVPAATYSSAISQADADQKAQNDINQHGQTYANNNGTCPNGTDISNWHISATVPSSTGHTIQVTVTRPAGDINNVNTAYFHIPSKSYNGSIVVPSGSTSATKTITFSATIGASSVSIILDSIN